MDAVIPFVLAVLAVLLAWVAPGLLARQRQFRRAPRAALVAWQAVTVGGILAALAAAPAAVGLLRDEDSSSVAHPWALLGVLGVCGLVLGRLLWSGHNVGVRLRQVRSEQRRLVDIVAAHDHGGRVRVLQHPSPTAYCIPGRGSRVVLSQGVLDKLPDEQLESVIAHEEAHLRGRHDLLLVFFSVANAAVPGALRSEAALAEVRLLVEALADRAAARRPGAVATARALVALAGSRTPDAALGAGTTAPVRLRLIADGPGGRSVSAAAYTVAALAAGLPVALLAAAWS